MHGLLLNVTKKLHFDIPLLSVYADDTIIAKLVLKTFNSYHKKLKFTTECEVDGAIPFLDIAISRQLDRRLTTNGV